MGRPVVPGREVEGRFVIGADLPAGFHVRRAVEEGGEILRMSGALVPQAQMEESVSPGRFEMGAVLLTVNERLGVGRLGAPTSFGGVEAVVQRHRPSPRAQDAEVGREPFEAIFEEEDHTVALAHTPGAEASGEAVRLAVELGPGDGAAAARDGIPLHERNFGSIPLCVGTQDVADGHVLPFRYRGWANPARG